MRNVSHRFMYLNSWSPVGGSVWESHGTFRRRSLLKEVPYWRCVLRVYKLLLVPFLCFLHVDENVTSQLPVPTTMLSLPVTRTSLA